AESEREDRAEREGWIAQEAPECIPEVLRRRFQKTVDPHLTCLLVDVCRVAELAAGFRHGALFGQACLAIHRRAHLDVRAQFVAELGVTVEFVEEGHANFSTFATPSASADQLRWASASRLRPAGVRR